MRTIYLTEDFRCCVNPTSETVMSVKTDFFDGKCDAFIEGYRFVPAGYTWQRKDGEVFEGEMIAPFKESAYLQAVQTAFEQLDSKISYIGMMAEVI